jgi:hypothetical protein
LVIPEKFYDDALLSPLFEVLNDTNFRKEVTKMPGYDISNMGRFVARVN